jgi:anti-sigma B factor antagonist
MLMGITAAIRQLGSVTIVDISGNIIFGETTSLRSVTNDLLSKGLKNIVFNLSDVDYIDSSGLSCLFSIYASVRHRGGELKLLSPTKKVRDLLRFTKLDAIFNILDAQISTATRGPVSTTRVL